MTAQEFARMLQATETCHEDSWNGERYQKSYDDCAIECGPGEWARIVAVLLYPGYVDVWDWCDEILL